MLKRIPEDKKKHIIAGASIALLFSIITIYLWPGELLLAIGAGFAISVVAGFGFELFSYVTGLGHAEVMDAVATSAGGAAGTILFGIGSLLF